MKWLYATRLLVVAVTLASLLFDCSWLPGTRAQEEGDQSDKRMTWTPVSNKSALCNDYTQAGYFIRRNESSNDWIVFLESGGLCFNRESCNRRFFVRKVRRVLILS